MPDNRGSPVVFMYDPASSMRPLVIAHRGASVDAPENTDAALRAAIEQGADMVEIDVRWSADAEPVLMHDPSLDRTTDGKGPLRALTLGSLERLDAGAWFEARFRGERVLTLREALAILGPRVRVNVELCADVEPPPGFAARLMRLVEEARLPEPPLYSSFDFTLLAVVRAEDPGAMIAPLFRTPGPAILRRVLAMRPAAAHPRRSLVVPSLVRLLHAEGTRVHAWTVNDERQARRLLRLGVDGIFTDHPARMVRLRDSELQRAAGASSRGPVAPATAACSRGTHPPEGPLPRCAAAGRGAPPRARHRRDSTHRRRVPSPSRRRR